MIFYINENLFEATNSPADFFNGQTPKFNPALVTWEEYYDYVNKKREYHESSAYNYEVGDLGKLKESKNKLIKTQQVGKITLQYYKEIIKLEYAKWSGEKYVGTLSLSEMKEAGLREVDISIRCIDFQTKEIVGTAQDEWGAALIAVVNEYKNLGIGEELVKIYRTIYPQKKSGGFTDSGYIQIQKYYNWVVSKFLAAGIYSDLIKKNEISKEKVKAILDSRPKSSKNKEELAKFSKEKTNPLAKYYGGNNDRLFYMTGNTIIVFDSALKDYKNIQNDGLEQLVSEKLVYAYLHVITFNDHEQIYSCYGNEKDLTMAIYLMTAKTNTEGGLGDYYLRNFDENISNIIKKIYSNKEIFNVKIKKDKGYISSIPLKLLSTKKPPVTLYNSLENQTKLWFKTNDKYNEIEDYIQELAYGLSI